MVARHGILLHICGVPAGGGFCKCGSRGKLKIKKKVSLTGGPATWVSATAVALSVENLLDLRRLGSSPVRSSPSGRDAWFGAWFGEVGRGGGGGAAAGAARLPGCPGGG